MCSSDLSRPALYTASTRPRQRLIYVGPRHALATACARDEPKRRTLLGTRIERMMRSRLSTLDEVTKQQQHQQQQQQQQHESSVAKEGGDDAPVQPLDATAAAPMTVV